MQTASLCKEHGAPFADVYTVDLTNPKAINDLATDLLEKHKTVDILVRANQLNLSSCLMLINLANF